MSGNIARSNMNSDTNTMPTTRRLTLLLCLASLLGFQTVSANEQPLLMLIEYISVDYARAVKDGEVINNAEYQEMLEFSGQIRLMTDELTVSDGKRSLQEVAAALETAVREKRHTTTIRSSANRLKELLIENYSVLALPSRAPDIDQGREIYQSQCASCHGKAGFGDGPVAKGLDPPATNFMDMQRYRLRTLSGLFNTISLGVEGTAMAGFAGLSGEDRWSLAFYVGSLAAPEPGRPQAANIDSFKTLVTITPAMAFEEWGDKGALEMAWLRRNPASFYKSKSSALLFSRQKLDEALVLYKAGKVDAAYGISLQAYLEGFELVEPAMRAVNAEAAADVEKAMGELRSSLKAQAPVEEIEASVLNLQTMLAGAQDLLEDSQLSPATAFTSALIILLREGLEAMLVVIALVAFLRRTGRKDGIMFIHFGWTGALIAGLITWWISLSLFNISGASREMTEGVAALAASAILLYVGFWMHDKAHANNWQRFIEQQAGKALSSGALWGLSGLAFIAVYREVFETILFYQALLTQTSGFSQQSVIYGLAAGVILLGATGFFITRYSRQLPIRQFFNVSAILMFVLAFILAGKGVAALQEAGWIDSHAITFINIDSLGIHPFVESLALQVFVLMLGVGYWLFRLRD
jgi:high-affinity iron transporter